MRLPPLNALRNFEAAARLKSFQKAAQELYVTPSAVSHQIKGLEEFLGLKLFIRQTRKLKLTRAGEDYFLSVRDALQEIEKSTQRLISLHESGHLHLSVSPVFLTRWLMPRIGQFRGAFPDVKLEISSATGLIDFTNQETDIAVYYGDGDWKDVEPHFLRHLQLRPVCHPRLLKDVTLESPSELLKYPLLHSSKHPDYWKNWFEEQGIEYEEKTQDMSFSSGTLAASAATNGLGFALVDLGLYSEEVSLGKLFSPFDHALQNQRSFYLVKRKDKMMTYAMKSFHGWIIEEMAKENAEISA